MKRFLSTFIGQWLAYLVVRGVVMAVDAMPKEFARGLGRPFGRLLHFIDGSRRRRAADNLRHAYPPVCRNEDIPDLVRRVYEHIGTCFIEMLRTPRMVATGEIVRNVELRRFELFDQLLDAGRGAISVIAHLGNWEIAGLAVCLNGYPLHSLARPVSNKLLNDYVERFRTQTGQRIIEKYDAIRYMMKVIRSNGLLVVQIDQDIRHGGVYPEFFGRPAATVRSPAILALRYNIPIIYGEIYRENGRHIICLHDPINPDDYRDREDPVEAMTQAYTSQLEEAIRRHPDQWLWPHRRWKTADRKARRGAEGAQAEEAVPSEA